MRLCRIRPANRLLLPSEAQVPDEHVSALTALAGNGYRFFRFLIRPVRQRASYFDSYSAGRGCPSFRRLRQRIYALREYPCLCPPYTGWCLHHQQCSGPVPPKFQEVRSQGPQMGLHGIRDRFYILGYLKRRIAIHVTDTETTPRFTTLNTTPNLL